MRTVTDNSREELERTLATEIASAREEARPVSRLTLSRLLQANFGLHPHEAERFVDQYCEEKAPAVPTYLSSEFGVPYLKVVAIVNVALSVASFVVSAVTLERAVKSWWIWLLMGFFFLGAAAVMWVQSIRPDKKSKNDRTITTTIPRMAVSPDPLASEPVGTASTGPLPPRS